MRKIPVYPGTPRERRDAAVRKAVDDTCRLRRGAAGGFSFEVELVERVAEVEYTVELTLEYREDYRHRAARFEAHKVAVRRSWRRDVLRRGLAGTTKQFVLHAEPMTLAGTPDHVEIFFAIWAEQRAGYAAETVTGLIARRVGGRELAFGRMEPAEDMRQGEAARRAIKQAGKFPPRRSETPSQSR